MPDRLPSIPGRREPQPVIGTDTVLLAQFVWVPLVMGPVIAFVLTMGFYPLTYALFTVLAAGMVAPALWRTRAAAVTGSRSAVYRRRSDETANTGMISGVLLGMCIYDIPPLPGGPIWTDQQPRAWVTLLIVIVYLIWISHYAHIPDEVAGGWRRLFRR